MNIKYFGIETNISPREFYLLKYCVSELLTISDELDLKRGFDLGTQEECKQLLNDLENIADNLSGERK